MKRSISKGLQLSYGWVLVYTSYHIGRTNCTKDPTAFIRCVNGMMDYFITARMISPMHSFEYWSPATVGCSWIRYRALYITWISLLIEWRHQSKIWCPFLCTAGFVYACVRLLCTGYTEGYTSQLRELWRCANSPDDFPHAFI